MNVEKPKLYKTKESNILAIKYLHNDAEMKKFCPSCRFYSSVAGQICAIDKTDCTERALIGDYVVLKDGEYSVIPKSVFEEKYIFEN